MNDIIKSLAEELIPCAGIFIALGEAGIQKYKESQEKKLKDFFQNLEDASPDEVNKWVENEDISAFFIVIIKWLKEDDITNKTPLYAKAFKIMARNQLESNIKREDFLRAVRDLIPADFEILKKLDNEEMKAFEISQMENSDKISIVRLRYVGALEEVRGTLSEGQANITNLGKDLIKLLK
jgi:hypothetical protein